MAGIPMGDGTRALAAPRRGQAPPGLKMLVSEASRALALLDAGRLEELAQCCEALNRDLPRRGTEGRRWLEAEAREAAGEMAVLGRVLEATSANLVVMERLRERRQGKLEYSAPRGAGWQPAGARYGND